LCAVVVNSGSHKDLLVLPFALALREHIEPYYFHSRFRKFPAEMPYFFVLIKEVTTEYAVLPFKRENVTF
jgi:hypothetical protein